MTKAYTNRIAALFIVLFILFASLPVTAVSQSDYTYTVTTDNMITITGYTGDETELIIPETINDLPVTAIGADAFEGNTTITSVTIPDNVTSIGFSAFAGCTKLEYITIPDSVTSIGYYAFVDTAYYDNAENWEDSLLYIDNCLIAATPSISGHCTIKPGTRFIAERAFLTLDQLTGVTIPDSVRHIDRAAFLGCNNLTNINIPDGITVIEAETFWDCNFTEITIPASVITIETGAFALCDALTSVFYKGTSHQWQQVTIAPNNDCFNHARIETAKGILGDVDSDGTITSTDARLTLQYYAGKITADALDLSMSDVDSDTEITSTDARLILQIYAGKIKEFP